MIRKLLFAIAVLLTAGLASAQPNLNYSFARDKEGVPIIGRGLRPTVTAEMGIPPGTPFYDTSTFLLYYWSGSAWTATGLSGLTSSGTAFTSTLPLTIPNGTAVAPALSFAANANWGLHSAASYISVSVGGTPTSVWTNNGIGINGGKTLAFTTGDPTATGNDVILARDSAATLQIGSDSGTATAQTIKGPDSTTADIAGATLNIAGGNGTAGNGAGGNLALMGGTPTGTGEPGGVIIIDRGTRPTCGAGIRGMLWYDQGGAGVADTFTICAKQAAGDTYAWRTAATIP